MVMQVDALEKLIQDITYSNILTAVVILIAAVAIMHVIGSLIIRFSERFGRYRIPVKTAVPVIKLIVYGATIVYILVYTLELTSTQFAAFAALLGAGIGFGLRDVFASVAGGILLALEEPYHVGDVIRLREHYGEVTNIGLRTTTLVTPMGNTVSVPNDVVVKEPVASSNAGNAEMLVVIDIYIDNSADADRAMKIVTEAVISSRYVYIKPDRQFSVFLNDFPFYRLIRAKAFVYDLRKEFDFRSDIVTRAWRAMAREGIKAPEAKIIDDRRPSALDR
jgi:small-conductance mechanosensitive channel